MRLARKSENITLFLQLDANDNSQYPRAVVMNAAGTIVSIVDLIVTSVDGQYTGNITLSSIGDYSVKYVVYSDVGYTTINTRYHFSDEIIRVSNLEQNVEDILDGNLGTPIAVFD